VLHTAFVLCTSYEAEWRGVYPTNAVRIHRPDLPPDHSHRDRDEEDHHQLWLHPSRNAYPGLISAGMRLGAVFLSPALRAQPSSAITTDKFAIIGGARLAPYFILEPLVIASETRRSGKWDGRGGVS
jgi:hypothetical protein